MEIPFSINSIYQAYKSEYTHNAFRLKREDSEDVIADISEISPLGDIKEESVILPTGHVDSDADSSGIYFAQD